MSAGQNQNEGRGKSPLPSFWYNSALSENKRIVFLDYLRVVACLMVMVVHACECFYFGGDGGLREHCTKSRTPLFEIAKSQSASYTFSKTFALAFKSATDRTNEQRQNLRLPLLICVYFCGPRRSPPIRSPSPPTPAAHFTCRPLPSNRGFGGIPRSLSVLFLDGNADVAV